MAAVATIAPIFLFWLLPAITNAKLQNLLLKAIDFHNKIYNFAVL